MGLDGCNPIWLDQVSTYQVEWGYSQPPSLGWMGYPHPEMRVAPPHPAGGGTPSWAGWEYPPPVRLDGVPPILRWGTQPIRPDYPIPHPAGWRYPPVDRQTFPSVNITLPRTSYAGGNKNASQSKLHHPCNRKITEIFTASSFFITNHVWGKVMFSLGVVRRGPGPHYPTLWSVLPHIVNGILYCLTLLWLRLSMTLTF